MLENNLGLDAWKAKFESYITAAQDNLAYVGAAFGALIILAGGLYWYSYSAQQKEQAATTILADCISQYEQAEQGKAQWADVVTMAHAGYEKFSSTKVAPYILAVEVDALLAQDKKQEALDKLDLMVSKIGSSSPLYDLYKLKQVLIKLDIPEMKERALAELQHLANARNSDFVDAAQYYLGLYYQNAGQQEKAVEIWKPLVAINDSVSDTMARSPWATLAQAKMNGLA
jgi:tetratricopeptide (TPR) repeat protein